MPNSATTLPRLTTQQRRAATGQFERAKQVLQDGNHDYCMQLLLACCKIDPGNLIYRQELRQSQRAKYKNNERGQNMAYFFSLLSRFRQQRALLKGNYLEALVQAELILMRNPWDLPTHLSMAKTFEKLGWPDHALWTLEQIRPLHPKDTRINRPLARLYEARGNFNQAIALWELVRKADPEDLEAQRKAKDLSASATIAKGRYEDAIKGEAPTPLVQVDDEEEESLPKTVKTESVQKKEKEQRMPHDALSVQERIKSDPKNANGYLHLASIYRRAEQADQARKILEQGLALTGNHFDIQQELLDLEIEPFRRDLAVAEEQLRTQPENKDLPSICQRLSKEIHTRELDYFRRRSDRNPTDMTARFEMGLRLFRIGQTDEAIKELQSVRNEPRFHGKALFYLGLCFKARKNWRLTQRNLEEALQQLSADKDASLHKEAMYWLALGYAENNEMNRAIDLGSDLSNLDYSYRDISQRIEEWQTRVSK